MATHYFAEWRTADRAAAAAEMSVLQLSLRAINDGAPSPSESESRVQET
jgi:hypothetical protein